MQNVPFYKMSGTGNDFIIIDNRDGAFNHLVTPAFVRAICRRRVAVGADGVIFIQKSTTCDFAWQFFNADGSTAEMCGNGARCAARYAVLRGIAGQTVCFETRAGVIRAHVQGARVKTQLTPPGLPELDIQLEIGGAPYVVHSINTGVPHVVCFVENVAAVAVEQIGRTIRFHPRFQPAGTNVNFVSQKQGNMLEIRTYERGVEGETLACGTGSVAAALIAITLGKATSPVAITTAGGDMLQVYVDSLTPPFHEVYLEGDTTVVFHGELWEEAWMRACRT
ncbi:MAG: diaminopimelate epimerase [Desulfobacterota bacterium]|nr:diaminopimelate epimerase [Thermodesulfobacteriota bacterium]